jgi:hypothetical protein
MPKNENLARKFLCINIVHTTKEEVTMGGVIILFAFTMSLVIDLVERKFKEDN